MALVGIIANPAASKDIRRLVAQGRVVPDWEKVNTIRRMMLGMQSAGVTNIIAMPDSSHLVQRAADDPHLALDLQLLQMSALYNEGDTVRAAAAMGDMGVDCVITLGGDGTNRAVVKGCRTMPMIAISTGTNNVFPVLVEGTMAGLAAALVARGDVSIEDAAIRSKLLEIYIDGQAEDIALVDVALSKERFVATRAIWDINTLYEVFLTRAEPASLGLSSIGARLQPVSLADEGGLQYSLKDGAGPGDGGEREDTDTYIRAPIAPGMVPTVAISSWRRLAEGEKVAVERRNCTVALDGERAFTVNPNQQLEIQVRRDGPPVIDVGTVLRHAATRHLFDV